MWKLQSVSAFSSLAKHCRLVFDNRLQRIHMGYVECLSFWIIFLFAVVILQYCSYDWPLTPADNFYSYCDSSQYWKWRWIKGKMISVLFTTLPNLATNNPKFRDSCEKNWHPYSILHRVISDLSWWLITNVTPLHLKMRAERVINLHAECISDYNLINDLLAP